MHQKSTDKRRSSNSQRSWRGIQTLIPSKISPFQRNTLPSSSQRGWGLNMPLKWSTVPMKDRWNVLCGAASTCTIQFFLFKQSGPLLFKWGTTVSVRTCMSSQEIAVNTCKVEGCDTSCTVHILYRTCQHFSRYSRYFFWNFDRVILSA